jgi:hypothetical protein
MVRSLSTAALLLLITVTACADTYVTADISVDTTWDLAGSPYVIQGDIRVLSPNTLTIDPGVVVEFDYWWSLAALDDASIVAAGTPGAEIVFTSHSPTPAPDDWWGVFPTESSVLTHCIFEFGRQLLVLGNWSPTITISSCAFRYSAESGIRMENASPLIEGCTFTDNPTAISVLGPGSPEIHGCNLYDNTENMDVRDYTQYNATVINAENNWWGVDDAVGIEATITIPSWCAPYVEVDFDPWLHEVPVEDTSWGRMKAMFVE